MKARYGDRVEFLGVYVREAHPTGGWRMASNDRAGVVFAQPSTFAERTAIAEKCCTALKMTIPLVVDEIDDRVGHAYSGMPDRLYLINSQGSIVYKGGRGPFGFKAGELEQAIVMNLLESTETSGSTWARLPVPTAPVADPLPNWAAPLAASLPRTTAAMLELDYLHRAKSPLEPKLRAKMRWVAAKETGSRYGTAYAFADLQRAGATAEELAVLQGVPTRWPDADRAALTFARKLTTEAYKVLDEEVADLRARYGDAQVVAMVQLLAYANFQDRLTQALGVEVEQGGPRPPLAVQFPRPLAGGAPPLPRSTTPQHGSAPERVDDPDWKSIDFALLQQQLVAQKGREPRIPVPSFEKVRPLMPATFPKDRELKIKWSLVCLGYQPELASAWTLCTRTFGEESQQDRVFEESLFWVVTRSLQCFY